jgi:hypothetical protein
MESVTIPKSEYLRLKRLERIDYKLIRQFANSLDDIKNGRVRRIA